MAGPTAQNILLVDDEPLVLDVCGAVLRNSGYSVYCSKNGFAGLELFREHARHLDLVIADIVMPDLSGPDMTREMLAEKPDLKVVYMSGYGAATVLPNGNGRQLILLVKPFTSDVLLQTVRQTIGQPALGAH